jgi:hypothetical protein
MKRPVVFLLVLLSLVPWSGSFAQYGAVNSVLSLDGASFLSVPSGPVLNADLIVGGAVSISAWVRPTATGSPMTIVGNNWTAGYWFGLNAQGRLRYWPNAQGNFEGLAVVPLNVWTHVAVSFDMFKNDLRFYINGVLDRQLNPGQTFLQYNTFDLRIGADRQGASPDYYWTGQLDEVRIWNTNIDFSAAEGLLFRIPLETTGGRFGRFMRGGWRFNGNALSVNGLVDGAPVGTPLYLAGPDPDIYSRIGLQLRNGANDGDHVTVPHAPALSLTQNFTLECWVRPMAGGHAQYQTFISKGSYAKNSWSYWLGLNKGNGRVRFIPSGNWSQFLESSASIPLNAWTHVAARFEQSGGVHKATIFLNGLPSGSVNFAQPGAGNGEDLLIGCSDIRSVGTTAYGFAGTIDEVRIWNVVRSDQEIADHHRMEFNGPVTGLLASYRLDGDDFDLSGYGHNGTGEFRSGSDAHYISTTSLPSLASLALTRPLGGEVWKIGDTEEIRWNAAGLIDVRIELSRDGGQTFGEVLAPSVPASPSVFSWVVTGPETAGAVVRVRPPSTLALTDESNAFEIQDPVPVLLVQPRQLVFTASENGPLPPAQSFQLLNTGGALLSWTAQKTSAQWYDLSAAAGTSNQDSVQVQINTTQLPVGTYTDNVMIGGNAVNAPQYVNVRLNIVPLVSYTVSGTVRTDAGAPVEGVKIVASGPVDQSAHTDQNGDYQIPGLAGGDYDIVPVSPYFDFMPVSETIVGLAADKSGVDFLARRKSGVVVVRYDAGWNLISLPLQPAQSDVATLFPDADGKAYEYVPSQGYVEVTSLEYGKGYWVKFSKRDSVAVTGFLTNTLDFAAQDQFGGWNLIGAPSGPAAISGIVQNPPGALLVVYAYDPALGYFAPADGMLRPGRGYFVKVNTDAVLHVVGLAFAPGNERHDK